MGLVFCHCNPDRPIYVVQYGAGRLFYSCRTDSHYGGCGLRVSERALDAWITDAIVEAVCGEAFAASIERRLKAAAADDPTPEDLEPDRQELGELDLILPTRFASDSHRARYAELQARIAQGEARLRAMPDLEYLLSLPRVEADFRRSWKGWTLQERRRAVKGVLKRITAKQATRRGRVFDEGRLDPDWKF